MEMKLKKKMYKKTPKKISSGNEKKKKIVCPFKIEKLEGAKQERHVK